MALELKQFVKQLEDSGIVPGETIKEVLSGQETIKEADGLARELIRLKKLTRFQAEELWRGRGKALVLGNYVLLEKIGAGGMGQVFKAEHRRMERKVAIKLLPAAMTRDKMAIARFEREVQAAARLRHPNIIAADDADQANGVHFLVMELVDGSDLSDLVKKSGPLSVDKAVNYTLQAARGLEFAHKEGVVHRDIKPANLLIDKKGVVKILDMGLARIEGTEGKSDLTTTGAVMGTVDYMAPEQAMDTKTADARADIYSLGCTFYYLLTGKPVYEGTTMMAKLLGHRDHPIPALSGSRGDIPEWVENVFRKSVAKKAEDRFQTMTEMIAALEGHLVGQTVAPPTIVETEAGLTQFFQDLNLPPRSQIRKSSPLLATQGSGRGIFHNKKILIVGGALLGFLFLLGGILFTLKTKDGTLVLEVNEPDAEVVVTSEQGLVEITRKGDKGPISISMDPGKHRLKIQKDGFEFYSKDFEITTGTKKTITAKLVPLSKKTEVKKPEEKTPAVAMTKPPEKEPAKPTTPKVSASPTPVVYQQPIKPFATPFPKLDDKQPPPAIAPFNADQARKHQEAWAAYLKVPVEFTNSIGMKFILIPPGEFVMGCDPGEIEAITPIIRPDYLPNFKEWAKASVPRHLVRITKPFYIQKDDVTIGQYQTLMKQLPELNDPSRPDHPLMANVSLLTATDFCDALSKKEGKKPAFQLDGGKPKRNMGANGYRLPTEAEWEYSCRAGTTTWWFFGNNSDVNTQTLRNTQSYHQGPNASPNPFGLVSVYGGSCEWCFDRRDSYTSEPLTDPYGEPEGGPPVIRGGAEYSDSGTDLVTLNSVVRQPVWVNVRWIGLGRLVLPIEWKPGGAAP